MAKRSYGIVFVVVAALLLANLPAYALEIGGELTGAVTYQWDEKEIGTAPVGFELNLDHYLGADGRLYLSTHGYADHFTDEAEIKLGEAYLAAYLDQIDLTLGRQVISWGTVDGFNPTNYFARMGSDALLQGEMKGEPLPVAQAAYYSRSRTGCDWTVTGVVAPFFTPQKIDGQLRSILAKDPRAEEMLAIIDDVDKPERSMSNIEYGVRAETMVGWWDVQFSAFTGFEPLPGLQAVTTFAPPTFTPKTEIEGKYRRQRFAGIATAGVIGDMGVRAELAYGGPTPFPESEDPGRIVTPLVVNKNYLQAAIGVDYTFGIGNGLLFQGQYIYRGNGSLLNPYQGEEPEAGQYLMGRMSYNFTLDNYVETTGLLNIKDKSGVILPSWTYRLPQGIELKTGLVLTYGSGEFESLPTQASFSVTYRF